MSEQGKQQKSRLILSVFGLVFAATSHSATISTSVYAVNGDSLGKVVFEDSKYGLMIKPQLSKLPVGQHGFHLHQHADCGNGGMNAGEHFDPASTNSHKGPYAEGHLGDLPVLSVNDKGEATTPLLAPRLKTSDISGLALMIHAGGDNYSDTPALGGGGARIGCGKIPS
jgi:Cu-Zn family superoxide dismutase